jgi:hypothetical protein
LIIFIEKGEKTLAGLAYLCYTAYINLCHLVVVNDKCLLQRGYESHLCKVSISL